MRRDHSDAGPERENLSSPRAVAFRKNEDRPAFIRQLAHVSNGLACAGFALRNREGVEKECGQPIIQAVSEPLAPAVALREEMRVEEFFGHCGGDTVAPACG